MTKELTPLQTIHQKIQDRLDTFPNGELNLSARGLRDAYIGFALRRWGFRRTNFQPTTKAKSEN